VRVNATGRRSRGQGGVPDPAERTMAPSAPRCRDSRGNRREMERSGATKGGCRSVRRRKMCEVAFGKTMAGCGLRPAQGLAYVHAQRIRRAERQKLKEPQEEAPSASLLRQIRNPPHATTPALLRGQTLYFFLGDAVK